LFAPFFFIISQTVYVSQAVVCPERLARPFKVLPSNEREMKMHKSETDQTAIMTILQKKRLW